MGQCLVTRLKEAVIDNSLEKLGVIVYNGYNMVGTTAGQRSVALTSDGIHEVSLYANNLLVGSVTRDTNPPYFRPDNVVGVIDGVKLEITNRYYVTSITSLLLGTWDDDYLVEHLKWMTKLHTFNPVGSGATTTWPLLDIYSGMFACGRTSGELATLCKCYINGVLVQSPTAVFEPSSVKVYNTNKTTLLATYDGTSWVYA